VDSTREKRILLVEDDQKSLFTLRSILQGRGHFVRAFESAEDAATVDPKQIDTAVLDINLPGQRGDEFAVQLMAHNPAIKIVFMTAYKNVSPSFDALPGVVILTKPLSVTSLLTLL
jgi:DNA-binding NtrC family response regulator